MQVVKPFQLAKFKNSVLAQQCERIGEQILNYQKYIDPIGRVVSNRGGWHSRFEFEGHQFVPFYDEWTKYLKTIIWVYYVDYIEKFYEKRYQELYGNRHEEQPYRIMPWFNISWPEDYNLEHVHLPADPTAGSSRHIDEYWYIPPEMKNDREFWLPIVTGTFYVTDSHNTFFATEVPFGTTEEKERKYIDLNAGDILIGHPGVNHGVSVNKLKIPRITISFNIFPEVVAKNIPQQMEAAYKE